MTFNAKKPLIELIKGFYYYLELGKKYSQINGPFCNGILTHTY